MRSMKCALARPVLRSIWVDATQPWHLGREVEKWNHLVPCSSPVLGDGGVLPSKIAVLEYGQRSFCQFGDHGRVDRRLRISYGLAVLLDRKAHEMAQQVAKAIAFVCKNLHLLADLRIMRRTLTPDGFGVDTDKTAGPTL